MIRPLLAADPNCQRCHGSGIELGSFGGFMDESICSCVPPSRADLEVMSRVHKSRLERRYQIARATWDQTKRSHPVIAGLVEFAMTPCEAQQRLRLHMRVRRMRRNLKRFRKVTNDLRRDDLYVLNPKVVHIPKGGRCKGARSD